MKCKHEFEPVFEKWVSHIPRLMAFCKKCGNKRVSEYIDAPLKKSLLTKKKQ